jgi:hypothetical protein
MAVLNQASLAPKEDLRPYAGKWIALRDGYVVASADDSVTPAGELHARRGTGPASAETFERLSVDVSFDSEG